MEWLPFATVVAGWFALRQIRLNNITNARIKWLETLRQTLADFISEVTSLSLIIGVDRGIDELKRNGEFSGNPSVRSVFTEELPKQLQRIQLKYDLIRLNLNPKENLHSHLEHLLDQYMKMVNRLPETDSNGIGALIKEMRECAEKLVAVVRVILKLEWEKTKRSRFSFYYFMRFGKGKEL